MTQRKRFPIGAAYDERRETERFFSKCLGEMLPRWEHYGNYLRAGPEIFSTGQLLHVIDRTGADLDLLLAGTGPLYRDRFEDALVAAGWAQLQELKEKNTASAKAELAKRRGK